MKFLRNLFGGGDNRPQYTKDHEAMKKAQGCVRSPYTGSWVKPEVVESQRKKLVNRSNGQDYFD